MSEPASDSAEAALHEYIDAEIAVAGVENPANEKKLQDTVEKLQGVQSVNFFHSKVAVNYDPVRVSKAQLLAAIRGAGFQVEKVESASSSPLTDALKDANSEASEAPPPARH